MNIKKRPATLCCLALFCLVINISVKAQPGASLLDRKIDSFWIRGASIHVALQNLAHTYKVPIGLEEIPEEKEAKATLYFDIALKDCTVRDVLSAILEQDPRYKWVEEDGVLNVSPVQTQDTFLDVLVADFTVSNVNREEVGSAIVSYPSVQKQIKKLGIAERNYVSTIAGVDEQMKRFSLNLHNVTVREILNETIRKGDDYYWLVKIYGSRYGGRDRYFMLVL